MTAPWPETKRWTTEWARSEEACTQRRRIVDELRRLRQRQRVTQVEMARRMGAVQTTVSAIECGRSDDVWLSTLQRYARALGYEVTLNLRRVKD